MTPVPHRLVLSSADAALLRRRPAELRMRLLDPQAVWFKRIFDMILASALLVIFLPLGLVIALAIWIESGRPIFFAHTRIGRDGRPFLLWKFRSMVTDADQVLRRHFEARPDLAVEWLHSHKLKDDPRVTRVGRFLRKRSLDELPQIWNVLRGDMSLIGPRPIVAEEVVRYGQTFRLYALVKPGLTGLWQVSGRNDTSYRTRIALDSRYVREWTPWLDFRILIRTLRVVLNGHGAY